MVGEDFRRRRPWTPASFSKGEPDRSQVGNTRLTRRCVEWRGVEAGALVAADRAGTTGPGAALTTPSASITWAIERGVTQLARIKEGRLVCSPSGLISIPGKVA